MASNALNYAFVNDISAYLAEPWMLRPYRHSVAEAVGEDLIGIAAADAGDEGLGKDRRTADAWAARLRIGDWYRWRTLE